MRVILTLFLVSVLIGACYGQDPVISPLVIEGREEDTVVFICDSGVMNGGFGISISVFDETVNNFIRSSDSRLVGVGDGQFANFTFGPLMASDNNTMFRCSSSRGISEVAVISVIFAPIIGRQSPLGDPIAVREGQAITVELNVSANPQPNSYEWTQLRNDMIQVLMNGNGITRRLDSVVFNPASREHSGEYRLVANNSAGSSEYNFTLDVQYPPTFPVEFVSPNTFNCSRDGEMFECASYPGVTTTLFCNAVGNPLPTVSRSLSGVSDQSNIDLMTGRDITITSVNANNAGTHTCVATSQLMQETFTITRTFRLYVGGVAQSLSDVEARIGDSYVLITWSYNNSRAVNPVPAQYFVATVSRDDMQIQGSPFSINVNTTFLNISGAVFEREQTYLVSVVVRNLQGDSEAVTESVPIPSNFNTNGALGNGGLSPGAIAGVVIGVIVGIIIYYC